MKAILCCSGRTACIPVRELSEALLPICNVPLLVHLLRFLERCGFTEVMLLDAESPVRKLAASLPLHMPVRFLNRMPVCDAPTLVLRRLCLPDWHMGELVSLCGLSACRLLRTDGSETFAELHPTGSTPALPPEETAAVLSAFPMPENPLEYRLVQQDMLPGLQANRLGRGCHSGRAVQVDEKTILGHDCIIGDHAVLEECVIGDGVQIGSGCVLRRCVICRHALVDRDTVLDDTFVEEGAYLPPGGGVPVKPGLLFHWEDGICSGLPRWNTGETALQAGAAMTALTNRLAVGYSTDQAAPLAKAAAAGAACHGAQVWEMGRCSLAQMIAAAVRSSCGAILWAQGDSVIRLLPFESDGRRLTAVHAADVTRAAASKLSTKFISCGKLTPGDSLHQLWEEDIRRILPEMQFSVEVSCTDPHLRETAQRLLGGGTGERIVLYLSEDGTQAGAFSLESGMVKPEQLQLLSLLSVRERGEALVLPADFHPAAEGFAARFGGRILRMDPEGRPAMAARLYTGQGICMDGIRLFAHILRILDKRHMTLAEAAALLPKMYTAKRELSTLLGVQAVEKLRRENPDPAVHISLPAYSRLAQLLVHAESMEAASELCGFWEKKLRLAEGEAS